MEFRTRIDFYKPDLLVSARIDESVHFMRQQDIFDLMSTLQDGIACNKFNEGLFSWVLSGNFRLQEKYQPKMYEWVIKNIFVNVAVKISGPSPFRKPLIGLVRFLILLFLWPVTVTLFDFWSAAIASCSWAYRLCYHRLAMLNLRFMVGSRFTGYTFEAFFLLVLYQRGYIK